MHLFLNLPFLLRLKLHLRRNNIQLSVTAQFLLFCIHLWLSIDSKFLHCHFSVVMGPSQNFHGSSISSQNFSSRVEFRAKNFRALFEPSQIRAANFSSELEQCSSQQNFLSTFCWSISFHVSKNIISSDI